MNKKDAPFDICWDDKGIAHVFATTVADAFRGMGYAEGSERLWQIHLSNLYATGTAASVFGERMVAQDLMHQAFKVPAFDMPASEGDWVVDAYLEGLNAYVDQLDELPPEFVLAGTEPRHYTRHDVASRYRFTGWFQHKSWMHKIYLGKLMARHGVDQLRNIVHRFSDADAAAVAELREALLQLDARAGNLLFPGVDMGAGSGSDASSDDGKGSNNWAVRGELSASGSPMLAMDPHQDHTIPNTFFYVHLNAPGFDAFGASFPGVPYFMMGLTRELTWGLTTGMVDTYDVYVERDRDSFRTESCEIAIAGSQPRRFEFEVSDRGPVLESLTDVLGLTESTGRPFMTSLHWSMRDLPTSAGVLGRLPLATSAEEFGGYLFENDVSPLVNNIICVDRHNDLRRFIAATLPKRSQVSGSVPLAAWREEHRFPLTTAADLLVEHNPASGFALTANQDTLGEAFFPLHNFPTHHSRSARIRELLSAHTGTFDAADFEAMQLDQLDVKARETLPYLLDCLDDDSAEVREAKSFLKDWDCRAVTDSKAASIYYALLERQWPIQFLHRVLADDLVLSIPFVAAAASPFHLAAFCDPDSAWVPHRATLNSTLCELTRGVVQALHQEFGEICTLGELQSISFRHTLSKHEPWAHMKTDLLPYGGSGTTLAMASHPPVPFTAPASSSKIRVSVGPVFRWVVDLADPLHLRFVASGGNGGRVDSPYATDHYGHWVNGRYFDLSLVREELNVLRTDSL